MLRMRAWRVVIIATCARSRMLFASTVFHCSALSVETWKTIFVRLLLSFEFGKSFVRRCCRWRKAFVRVESLLPCEFVSALIFLFSACALAWVVFLRGWRYSITFHERARSIEGMCASLPEMDDDDLDTSEYYRDAQSFRALRKRKSKTDSTAGSRAGLRGSNGGNCPGPPAARGPPVMKFICFK